MKAKGNKAKFVPKVQDGDTIFERAYLFYRKNQNKEALAEIAKGDESEVRFMELKAQLFYRLERAEEALQLFSKLLEVHSDEYDEIRRANAMAVIALLQSKGVHPEQKKQLDTFEQMYNYACYLIYQDKFGEAIQLLKDAAVKCRETLTEDGLTEEEIQEELAIIEIQKAYALQKAGSTDESIKIYIDMEKNSSADTNVKAIIMNNLLAAKVVSNTPNVREHLRNISKKKKAKLTHFQKQAILFNLALLQLHPVEKGKSFEEFVTGKLNKRKRKRKTKLPKNYDPNVAPDPERWLPRQERTAYKKKLNKKFKDRDIGRGTQKWFARFKSGDKDVEDKEGRGGKSDFDDNALLEAVEQDESQTTRTLAEQFGVHHSTIVHHVQKLGKLRYIMLNHFEKGWTAAQSFGDLAHTYGDDAINERQVRRWFARFKLGNTDVEDRALEEDSGQTTRMLAEKFDVSHMTIDRHLHQLGKGAGSSQAAATNIDYSSSKAGSVEPQPSPKPTPGGTGEGPRQQRPGGAQQAKKGKKKRGGKW